MQDNILWRIYLHSVRSAVYHHLSVKHLYCLFGVNLRAESVKIRFLWRYHDQNVFCVKRMNAVVISKQ